MNTAMAISASCITACAVSRICLQHLDMEVGLNGAPAGGVSIGSSPDLVVAAGSAMAIGALAGIVPALGFLYLGPLLEEKIRLHGTCGVHNLHGMPGVIGDIIGAFSAGIADSSFDQVTLEATFPKMKEGRSSMEQAMVQLAALGITLSFSISGGIFSGFVASRFGKPDELFDGRDNFMHVEYPDKEEEESRSRKPRHHHGTEPHRILPEVLPRGGRKASCRVRGSGCRW